MDNPEIWKKISYFIWQHVLKKKNIKDVGLKEQKKDCRLGHRLLEVETVLTPASL